MTSMNTSNEQSLCHGCLSVLPASAETANPIMTTIVITVIVITIIIIIIIIAIKLTIVTAVVTIVMITIRITMIIYNNGNGKNNNEKS